MDNSVIVVLNWVDGFGNDTEVEGIYKTVEEAREDFRPLEASFRASGEPLLRYLEVPFGKSYLDYDEADLLFQRMKKGSKEEAE